jgi:TPR repeat protein
MKKFIKMNDNKNFLSLGNIFDVIKSVAHNKETAMQSELFCALFNVPSINATTVNNYCVGARAISVEYKKRIIELRNLFKEDSTVFLEQIASLINILDDYVHKEKDFSFINESDRLQRVCEKLINIAKNDEYVSNKLVSKFQELYDNRLLYECFFTLFCYAVIDNIQPIYKQDIDIKINKEELDDYLKIKLYEGFSYTNSLIALSHKNNMYACADLGSMEFYGEITGKRNYQKSYKYYLKAADKGHPKACFMIANLIYTKKVEKDFETFWKYLNKAIELGSSAALNTMGLCYKFGINKEQKIDIEKAKYYFQLSSEDGYVYAYNNLGLLEEDEEKALYYFKISADLGESWALNRVGEYYRKNNNLERALIYYKRSIEAPIKERNKWAYYNLATYYYAKGCPLEDFNTYEEYMDIFNGED